MPVRPTDTDPVLSNERSLVAALLAADSSSKITIPCGVLKIECERALTAIKEKGVKSHEVSGYFVF